MLHEVLFSGQILIHFVPFMFILYKTIDLISLYHFGLFLLAVFIHKHHSKISTIKYLLTLPISNFVMFSLLHLMVSTLSIKIKRRDVIRPENCIFRKKSSQNFQINGAFWTVRIFVFTDTVKLPYNGHSLD